MSEEVNRRATTTQQQPSSDPQSHTAPRRRPAEAHRGGEADPQPRYEQRTQAGKGVHSSLPAPAYRHKLSSLCSVWESYLS